MVGLVLLNLLELLGFQWMQFFINGVWEVYDIVVLDVLLML